MSGVQTVEVGGDDDGVRLDRWFGRRFPQLTHGRLEKLLRTGQVRVDGARVKASHRLEAGQQIRVPPLPEAAAPPPDRRPVAVSDDDAAELRALVLHRDDQVIVLDKPAGLAVQGGTGKQRHLDGMLDALRFDAGERPRLVHRLDQDTSGVLVLARTAAAARHLTAAFRGSEVRKVYWAVVVGVPKPEQGRLDLALVKRRGAARERVRVDDEEGLRAVTDYAVVDRARRVAAWVALRPVTGRTHQLRAHCAALGTPILGDGKYGGHGAFLEGIELARRLHLHARQVRLPHPSGRLLTVVAPLPPHMAETFRSLGFSARDFADPFD